MVLSRDALSHPPAACKQNSLLSIGGVENRGASCCFLASRFLPNFSFFCFAFLSASVIFLLSALAFRAFFHGLGLVACLFLLALPVGFFAAGLELVLLWAYFMPTVNSSRNMFPSPLVSILAKGSLGEWPAFSP